MVSENICGYVVTDCESNPLTTNGKAEILESIKEAERICNTLNVKAKQPYRKPAPYKVVTLYWGDADE